MSYRSIERIDGYLPIADHGLIGNGATAALVGRDGALSWMCVPRFDSPPLFAGLLDAARGGAFRLAPHDLVESRQFYEADTGVLATELRGRSSLIRITDALTLTSGADLTEDVSMGRQELLRHVTALEGTARVELDVAPRGAARAEPAAGGLRILCPERTDLDLHLAATVPLDGLQSTVALRAGETAAFRAPQVPFDASHYESRQVFFSSKDG